MAKKNEDTLSIDCACGGCWHHLHVIDWEDGTYDLQICNLDGLSIWTRLGMALKVISGKDTEWVSIVLYRPELEALGFWIKGSLKKQVNK